MTKTQLRTINPVTGRTCCRQDADVFHALRCANCAGLPVYEVRAAAGELAPSVPPDPYESLAPKAVAHVPQELLRAAGNGKNDVSRYAPPDPWASLVADGRN